jgi:hypothetical protein
MGEKTAPFGDLTTPTGAYLALQNLAKELIALRALQTGTKTSAIDDLSEDLGLGSALKKLSRGERVVPRLDLYARICEALEKENERISRRVEHTRLILKHTRPENAAAEGDRELGEASLC